MRNDPQVILTTIKPTDTRRPPITLAYRTVPCPQKQKRFANRTALAPEIELNDYLCRAVIDWVQVRVDLARPTQFQWVQREIEIAVGVKVYASIDGDNPGAADTIFHIRFQEPTSDLLRKGIAAVSAKFGLLGEPAIEMLEVSVDFTPKESSFEARARMHGVLTRHLQPSRDVLTQRMDRPRFSWGLAELRAFVFGLNGRDRQSNPGLFASAENDRPVPVDSTTTLAPGAVQQHGG